MRLCFSGEFQKFCHTNDQDERVCHAFSFVRMSFVETYRPIHRFGGLESFQVLKYGLNHVTTLVENKLAKLVLGHPKGLEDVQKLNPPVYGKEVLVVGFCQMDGMV